MLYCMAVTFFYNTLRLLLDVLHHAAVAPVAEECHISLVNFQRVARDFEWGLVFHSGAAATDIMRNFVVLIVLCVILLLSLFG